MDGPDTVFECSGGRIRIARFGTVFAGVYHSGLTAAVFDEVLAWQAPQMPADPITQFSLAFGAHRLAPDVQAAADRLLTTYGPRTCASATVLCATGFQASAARAALATIYLITRVSYPRRVFANVAEAEGWLASLAALTAHRSSIAAAAKWLADVESIELARAAIARDAPGR